MFEAFQNSLRGKFGFLNEKRLLLAVSGGVDSMVLADLFRKSGADISIAHCNFSLREGESNDDETFVKAYCDDNGIPFFSTRFDTQSFAADYKLSIQVAARRLRYAWFGELMESNGFDHLLTAHHADDNLETFLINLSRGTGLDGLTGIPELTGNIVRPLLAFSKNEIESYAVENQIEWREDSSNSSDKYLRNQLRHGVIPVLKNINANFLRTFSETLGHLRQSQSMVRDASVLIYKQVAIEKEDKVIFRIHELKRLPNYRAYLYEWLRNFGFTSWNDIYHLPDAQSGKQVFSERFVLLKDREVIVLAPVKSAGAEEIRIDRHQDSIHDPINLSFCKVADIGQANDNRIFVDADKLNYPLTLRRWRKGDSFQPFGMSGAKTVSKYFKDEKFSLFDKAETWLLCTDQDIIWIVGHRADDRFKITDSTKHILQITAS